MKNKLMIIDGNSLVYRAYFGSAFSHTGVMRNSDGIPTNAIVTFYRMLEKLFREYHPSHLFIAFDAGSKTFRHEKMKDYKAGRSKTPDDLITQFPLVKEMLTAWGVKWHEEKLIEADDLVGSFAKKYGKDIEVLVVSSDKDLLQLVDENISIAVPKNGNNPNVIINKDNFMEKVGCTPKQVTDWKGIAGDSSDNLKGVVGIGDKGALKLISEYASIENIYENIDQIKGKTQEKLIQYKEDALLCKDIATIKINHEVIFSLSDLEFANTKSQKLVNFMRRMEIKSILRQIEPKSEENAFKNLLL